MQLGKIMEANEFNHLLQSQTDVLIRQIKQDENMHAIREVGNVFPTTSLPSIGPSEFAKSDDGRPMLMGKDVYESLVQPSLNISLSSSSMPPNFLLPFTDNAVEGMEQSKSVFSLQQGPRTRHILPKPPNSSLTIGSEANKTITPEIRIARPPAEGRGRNQLLPRYWPRITDQELQQLSGEYPQLLRTLNFKSNIIIIEFDFINILVYSLLQLNVYLNHVIFKFEVYHCAII